MPSPTQQTSPPSALTPVQAQVVLALGQGVTITAAAQAAGVHRTTIYNCLKSQGAFDFSRFEMDYKQFRYYQAIRRAERDSESGAEPPPAR